MGFRDNEPPQADPIAYFLTWTTYGTWLPGDERGWVRRDGKFKEPNPNIENAARKRMTEKPFRLESSQRTIVERTIANHCEIRGWQLWIVRCLSNHVHVVLSARDVDPDIAMTQFKAWCTRRLKEAARVSGPQKEVRRNWWTERGSTRFINDETGLEGAILYVRDAQ